MQGNTSVISTQGEHCLLELSQCAVAKLQDLEGIRRALLAAAEAAGSHVLEVSLHRFTPQGVSGVAVIEESHISVHTWPECAYAAVDFYTCGSRAVPVKGCEYLREYFEAKQSSLIRVKRGLPQSDGVFGAEVIQYEG